MIHFAIYNQLEENLIIRLNIRISRQGSLSSKKVYMFENGEDPKHPI